MSGYHSDDAPEDAEDEEDAPDEEAEEPDDDADEDYDAARRKRSAAASSTRVRRTNRPSAVVRQHTQLHQQLPQQRHLHGGRGA
jgi:hypothetical protein